jgi:hypothetical protein
MSKGDLQPEEIRVYECAYEYGAKSQESGLASYSYTQLSPSLRSKDHFTTMG